MSRVRRYTAEYLPCPNRLRRGKREPAPNWLVFYGAIAIACAWNTTAQTAFAQIAFDKTVYFNTTPKGIPPGDHKIFGGMAAGSGAIGPGGEGVPPMGFWQTKPFVRFDQQRNWYVIGTGVVNGGVPEIFGFTDLSPGGINDPELNLVKGVNGNTGWDPPALVYAPDGHVNPNSARVDVNASAIQPGPLKVMVRPSDENNNNNLVARNFGPYYSVQMNGSATAGLPTDGDVFHVAWSSALVRMPGKSFVVVGPGQPVVVQQAAMKAPGAFAQASLPHNVARRDPVYMSLMDTTDPDNSFFVSDPQVVMQQNIDVSEATLVMDSLGIYMSVSKSKVSSAAFSFETPSAWVANPYAYGGSLLSDGRGGYSFSAFGETSNLWEFNDSDPDFVSAFLSFSSIGGDAFDYVDVQAPTSLGLLSGREYTYMVGIGDYGVVAVPEPSGLALSAFGALGAVVALRRLRFGERMRRA